MIHDDAQKPGNLIELHGDSYAWSLHVWGDAIGELWDHNKKDYIEAKELPASLLKAHEDLWEMSGDDFLVEYKEKYYYMMDYVYNENLAREWGLDQWDDLYNIALQNAIQAAKHEALKDALVLVAKKSGSLGAMHVVSVLVNAEETRESVEKMRQVLSECMFKAPERSSLDEKIQSAENRAENAQPVVDTKTKEPYAINWRGNE